MDETILEQTYQESLEERLIAYIAEQNGFSLEKAMDVYYHSKLADKIHQGTEGIQYLDYKVLADIFTGYGSGTVPVRQEQGKDPATRKVATDG